MNRHDVLARFDEERRSLPAPIGLISEQDGCIRRGRTSDGKHHWISFSAMEASNADAVIAGEIEYYRSIASSFGWNVYSHDQPPDLLERLQRHGFEAGPREAVLIFDLNNHADWIENLDVSCVVRVENEEQIADYQSVYELAFGKAYEHANELIQALRAGSRDHCGYIAYSGNQPVCAGRLQTQANSWFGGLYGGGTVPAFRGKGFYRALVAARARDALHLGLKYLHVDALPTSQPILQKLGFTWLTDQYPCAFRSKTANPP